MVCYLKVNADYDCLKWYGLGPKKRMRTEKGGQGNLEYMLIRVKENMAKYIVPQNVEQKKEVRWATVTDRKGRNMV